MYPLKLISVNLKQGILETSGFNYIQFCEWLVFFNIPLEDRFVEVIGKLLSSADKLTIKD